MKKIFNTDDGSIEFEQFDLSASNGRQITCIRFCESGDDKYHVIEGTMPGSDDEAGRIYFDHLSFNSDCCFDDAWIEYFEREKPETITIEADDQYFTVTRIEYVYGDETETQEALFVFNNLHYDDHIEYIMPYYTLEDIPSTESEFFKFIEDNSCDLVTEYIYIGSGIWHLFM